MKQNFDRCLKAVLKHEGGFVNHPEDPGGMTNMGITALTYAEYTGRRLSTITEKEMRSLTVEMVAQSINVNIGTSANAISYPVVQTTQFFDYAVNSGPTRAAKHLQECLAINTDGIIGAQTLKYVENSLPSELLREYLQRREDFLKGLRTFKTFGRGWMRRVSEVKELAESLMQEQPSESSSTIDDATRQRALKWAQQQK